MTERNRLADVIPLGDRRDSLEALRDRLADELDDLKWEKHKRECTCVCGMGDGRTLVAIAKELRTVIAELDSLPDGAEVSELDDLRDRRARRLATASGT